ncbi:hypothetical protein Lac2_03250 [Claveliimonas bilis]|nr:hypothetical protein Lac2_03250 [Claveliimonas bilis]
MIIRGFFKYHKKTIVEKRGFKYNSTKEGEKGGIIWQEYEMLPGKRM